MGAYLNKPQTDKVTEDDAIDILEYGASSMQGWRISQEDEHNCCPKFDTDTALFAVYDGHGGAEVAQYMKQNFPDFLRNSALYKEGKISEALEQAYLDFDAKLIDENVQETLKQLAGLDSDEENEEEKEQEAAKLFEEAHMPLDQLMLRYKSRTGGTAPPSRRFKKDKTQSPMIRNRFSPLLDCPDPESGDIEVKGQLVNGHSTQGDKSAPVPDSSSGSTKSTEQQNGSDATLSSSCVSSSKENNATCTDDNAAAKQLAAVSSVSGTAEADCSSSGSAQPASASNSSQAQDDTVGSSGVSSSKPGPGPGGSSSQDGEPCSSSGSSDQKVSGNADSESSMDEDEETSEDDTSDEDVDENRWKISKGPCDEEDDDDTDDDDSDSYSDEDGDGAGPFGADEDEEDENQVITGGEEPGYDSGCTAVVALLRGSDLFVANTGDSRCVLSRAGKAVDMSEDHKPEDAIEQARIIKAGGRITADGRVNGGLNMSRAIGDHRYKMNEEVAPRDQMITALPDVRTATLQDEDEFLVVACDGIWNTMSSQDVVTFVRDRIHANVRPLSAIIGEMFDLCLASSTAGDGTGCDNMTCIIVNLKPKNGQSSEAAPKETIETKTMTDSSQMSEYDITASDEISTAKRKADSEQDDGESSANKKSKMDSAVDSSC